MSEAPLPALRRRLAEDPALEGAFVSASPRPRLAYSLHAPGILRGGLSHLEGPAATEAVLALLAEHRGLKAAWVEARLTAYPPGFLQRGVDLSCLLFVEAPASFPWALSELVRSQAFALVAVATPLPDAKALRRLQLAAERAACAVLLAGPLPEEAWAVRERLWCGWEEGALRLRPAAEFAPRAAAGL